MMSGQNNFNFYFYKWKTSFRKKIHRTCIRPWVRAFPKINNIPRWGKCFVSLFSWTFCCPVLGSWQCVYAGPALLHRSTQSISLYVHAACTVGESWFHSHRRRIAPLPFSYLGCYLSFFNIFIQYIYIVLPISKDLLHAKANLTFERVVCVYLSIWILKEQLRIS